MALSKEVIQTLVHNFSPWYHQIQLPHEIVTPGMNNSSENLRILDSMGLPKDCLNKRVLDLGCRDGYFSFEMERRGGKVLGIDNIPPHSTGFSIVNQILGSQVVYQVDNVYNIGPEKYGVFDIVLFLGLLYHLRYPLLAIDKIRTVTQPGSLVFVETHLIDQCLLLPDGQSKKLSEISSVLGKVPLLQFYPKSSLANDGSNKFAPNMRALIDLFEEAQFKVLNTKIVGSRGFLVGRCVDDPISAYWQAFDTHSGNGVL